MTSDLHLVDQYLSNWDRFANGERQLVPKLRDGKELFEAALIRLLEAGHKGAVARAVFYPVVQVGGGILVDSRLGRALRQVLGPNIPVTVTKDTQQLYFAGDLYFWWEANRREYEPYVLFEDWKKREFANTVVIPMYMAAAKRRP